MIEIVSRERCVTCDRCVEICPKNVFDRGGDGAPVIARHSDRQTCFMCEAYCPADALFVASFSRPEEPDSPPRVAAENAGSRPSGGHRDRTGRRGRGGDRPGR